MAGNNLTAGANVRTAARNRQLAVINAHFDNAIITVSREKSNALYCSCQLLDVNLSRNSEFWRNNALIIREFALNQTGNNDNVINNDHNLIVEQGNFYLLRYVACQVTGNFRQNLGGNNQAHRCSLSIGQRFYCQTMSVGANKGNFAVSNLNEDTGEQRTSFVVGAGENSFLDELLNHGIFNSNALFCIENGEFRIILFIH